MSPALAKTAAPAAPPAADAQSDAYRHCRAAGRARPAGRRLAAAAPACQPDVDPGICTAGACGMAAVRTSRSGTRARLLRQVRQHLDLRRRRLSAGLIEPSASNLAALVLCREDGRLIRANPAFLKLTGLAANELRGRTYQMLVPENAAALEQEALEGLRSRAAACLHRRKRTCSTATACACRVRISGVRTGSRGGRRAAVLVDRDRGYVTARKQMVEAPQAQRVRRPHAVRGGQPYPQHGGDLRSRRPHRMGQPGVRRTSTPAIYAARPSAVRPARCCRGPIPMPRRWRACAGRSPRARSSPPKILNYAKDGRAYWVALECAPVFDHAGELERYVAIERDITETRSIHAPGAGAERASASAICRNCRPTGSGSRTAISVSSSSPRSTAAASPRRRAWAPGRGKTPSACSSRRAGPSTGKSSRRICRSAISRIPCCPRGRQGYSGARSAASRCSPAQAISWATAASATTSPRARKPRNTSRKASACTGAWSKACATSSSRRTRKATSSFSTAPSPKPPASASKRRSACRSTTTCTRRTARRPSG